MNKKILAGAIAVPALMFGAIGIVNAGEEGTFSPLVENLAAKFGVSAETVHEVFEETRLNDTSMKLDEAIAAGDITEDQKALLLEKQEEMHAKMELLRSSDMAEEEQREAMRQIREEHRAWAEDNGIELRMMFGKGGDKGFGGMREGVGERTEIRKGEGRGGDGNCMK